MTRETRLVGIFAAMLGLGAVLVAAWSLFSGSPIAAQGSSCKALCGVGLIVGEMFGQPAGAATAAVLLLCAGLAFTYAAYRILRNR